MVIFDELLRDESAFNELASAGILAITELSNWFYTSSAKYGV